MIKSNLSKSVVTVCHYAGLAPNQHSVFIMAISTSLTQNYSGKSCQKISILSRYLLNFIDKMLTKKYHIDCGTLYALNNVHILYPKTFFLLTGLKKKLDLCLRT